MQDTTELSSLAQGAKLAWLAQVRNWDVSMWLSYLQYKGLTTKPPCTSSVQLLSGINSVLEAVEWVQASCSIVAA